MSAAKERSGLISRNAVLLMANEYNMVDLENMAMQGARRGSGRTGLYACSARTVRMCPVVLIDHNVGVSPLASCEIKKIDTDYFLEE